MKNEEEAEIVTSDEEPDEDEMNAKEKQEYTKRIKKIREVTFRDSDTESEEDGDKDSKEDQENDVETTDVVEKL